MALVILGATLLTYFYGREVLRAHSAAAARHRLIADSERLISSLKDAETGQRGFLLTGDDNYLQPYQDAVGRLPQQLAALDRPEEPRLANDEVARIRGLTERILGQLQNTIEVRRSDGLDAAAAAVKTGVEKQMMDELRGVIIRLQNREEIALRGETTMAERVTRRHSGTFILSGVASLLFVGWTYRRISAVLADREAA